MTAFPRRRLRYAVLPLASMILSLVLTTTAVASTPGRAGSSVREAPAVANAIRSAREARSSGTFSASSSFKISSAGSYATSTDPLGDNGPGYDPRGDIVKYGVADNGTTITLALELAQFDSAWDSYNWRAWALGDPNWLHPTVIIFSAETDADLYPDYDVYFYWTPIGVKSVVTVFDQPGTVLCTATPYSGTGATQWNGAMNPWTSYSVDLPASCIGSPAQVRGTAWMYYESAVAYSVDYTDFTDAVVPPGSPPPPPPPVPASCSAHDGYWLLGKDGGVFSFGTAEFYGSTGSLRPNKPVVGMASAADGSGYWFVASDGGIFAYGPGAQFYGSTGSLHLNQPVVGMAARPQGDGYWLVASDGGIFAFGNAQFYGSTGSLHLNQPVVGMATTPTGLGYWLVAADGGIFAFGDAQFYGSTGSLHLNKPIVGMTAAPTGNGYWFVASDGGIFAFGDAQFHGSLGSANLSAPIVGMHVAASTDGYRMAASDGSVFSFNAPNCGNMSGYALNAPIIAVEAVGSPL